MVAIPGPVPGPVSGPVSGPSPRATALGSLRRLSLGLRRRVLRHRRSLAFGCAVVSVLAGFARFAPVPPPTDVVVVADRPVPAGTVLTAADVHAVAWPRGTAPDGALGELDAALGQRVGLPLVRGEPVTTARLRRQAFAAAYPDLVAVPVRFPDVAMVDLLNEGDLINVVATDPQHAQALTLLRGAPVLAIPQAVNTPSGAMAETARPGQLVVLGVPADSVENLAEHAVTDFLIPTFSG